MIISHESIELICQVLMWGIGLLFQQRQDNEPWF